MMEQQRRGFIDRPVRMKWLLWVAVILIVAALVIFGLQLWQTAKLRGEAREAIREQIRLEGVALAQTIAITSREDIIRSRYGLVEEYFAEIVRQPNVRYLIVMTPNGNAVVHTNARFRGKRLTDEVSRKALEAQETLAQNVEEENLYDVAVPVMSFTKKAAVVRIGMSYEETQQLFEE